jgi:hypothetical protein
MKNAGGGGQSIDMAHSEVELRTAIDRKKQEETGRDTKRQGETGKDEYIPLPKPTNLSPNQQTNKPLKAQKKAQPGNEGEG